MVYFFLLFEHQLWHGQLDGGEGGSRLLWIIRKGRRPLVHARDRRMRRFVRRGIGIYDKKKISYINIVINNAAAVVQILTITTTVTFLVSPANRLLKNNIINLLFFFATIGLSAIIIISSRHGYNYYYYTTRRLFKRRPRRLSFFTPTPIKRSIFSSFCFL